MRQSRQWQRLHIHSQLFAIIDVRV